MRRAGLTVVELLVVLGIVAILIGLAIPALQQAQDDARMVACKNNLKKLALGLHNYHDVYRSFPPGWVTREPHPGAGPRFGWQACLTPYIDQAPLFNTLDFRLPPTDPKNKSHLLAELKVLRCPADRAPSANSLRGGYGTSNYSGNYGPIAFPRWAPLGISDAWPGAIDPPGMPDVTGIFARNFGARIAYIRDGTSNTLLVGERCFTSGAGLWMGVTDNSHEDDTLTDCSHGSRPNAGPSSYSSQHRGGINVTLCDGSVRFIANSIDSRPSPGISQDMGIWQRLAAPADGLPVNEL